MNLVTVVGLIAACCTTAAFVPQVVKTWRSRSSADLSMGMYLLLTSGSALWLTYGLLVGDIPIVAANGVTLLLLLSVVWQMVAHRRDRPGERR